MISQKQFDKLESQYGCGYWNVCWEHACPCAITVEHKGLQESIYNSLIKDAQEVAASFDDSYDSLLDYYEEEDNENDYLDEEEP